MIPVLLLPAAVLLVGGYLFQHLSGRRYRQTHRRLTALGEIRALRKLLEKIPQHRGMANALLQGDASFGAKLQTLQQRIDADAAILASIAGHAGNPTIGQRIRRIETQWTELKQGLRRLSAARSFTRHSELVGELLYLINDLGEEAGLLDDDTEHALLADAAINLLPLVTETQGQARGMGTGAAAQKACDIPLQVKLRFLLQRTRSTIETAQTELQGKAEAQGLEASLAASEEFLRLLETRILDAGDIDIPPDEVFATATRAIDKSFALLDQLLDTLQRQLEAEAARCRRYWRISQLTAAGLLAPAAWLVQLAV